MRWASVHWFNFYIWDNSGPRILSCIFSRAFQCICGSLSTGGDGDKTSAG